MVMDDDDDEGNGIMAMAVYECELEEAIIWDADAVVVTDEKNILAMVVDSNNVSSRSRIRNKPDEPEPWTDLVDLWPWENDVLWDANDISPSKLPLWPSEEPIYADISVQSCYLVEDVRPPWRELRGDFANGQLRIKPFRPFPHRDKTEKLLGRTGILSHITSYDDEQYGVKIGRKDPYNLSNDEYYLPMKITYDRTTTLQHAAPVLELRSSLIPTHLGPNKLRKFHRPSANLLVNGGGPHRINALTKIIMKKAKAREAARLANAGILEFEMKTIDDLSPKDGELVLIEYCEENPPLLSQIGMCSKILNYFKRPAEMNEIPPTEDLGENVISQVSPFLGGLSPRQLLQAIENHMYRAPIYKHSRSNTDFILVISRNGFSIREYDYLFTAGQECPLMEVPSPNSRAVAKYHNDLLQVYIYRLFSKSKETPKRLAYHDLKNAFPMCHENLIRKRLRLCAEFKKGQGEVNCWVLNEDFTLPTEEQIRELVAPEQCCAYLSCLAAEQRLRDAGYGAESLFCLEDDNGENSHRKIEDEANFAPWNTTKAFIGAMNGKFILDVAGQADPTGVGEGFSYVRLKNNTKDETSAQEKRAVCGTDADLRKLGIREAKQYVRKLGVPESEIMKMNRWEIIDVLRTLSTKKASRGEEGIHKFSRGKFNTPTMNAERFREECQRLFDLQNRMLSADTVLTSDEEESSDEDESESNNVLEEMGRNVEKMLFENKSGQEFAFEKEEQERKKLRKMIMGNEIIQGDKARDKSAETDKQITNLTSKPGRVLHIRRVFKHPLDGTEYVRTEKVRSPSVIDIYLRMRATKNEEFIKKFVFADEQDKLRKEKRRLQDQIRSIKQGPQPPKARVRKPKKPKILINQKLTCSACGQGGHMRTNRSCPNFTDTPVEVAMTEQELENEENRLNHPTTGERNSEVNLDGTKFRVTGKLAMNIEDLKRRSVTLKIRKDDLTKYKKKKQPESEYEYYRKHHQTNNRSRLDSHVMISNIFEEIVNAMRDDEASTEFILPVSKKIRDYYELIETPMCIQYMRDKIRNRQYESRTDFLKDVKLLVDNSVKYNGENHLVTVCAKTLMEIAESMIEERSTELQRFEVMINPLLDEDSKRRLNYILGKIVDQVKHTSEAFPFLRPVSKKTCKTYYEVIKHPMDLELIGIKIEQCAYNSRFEFLKDMDLIQFNAVQFNGIEHEISKLAANMCLAIHKALQPLDTLLTQLEIKITKDFNAVELNHGERELAFEPVPDKDFNAPSSSNRIVMPLDLGIPMPVPTASENKDADADSGLRKRSHSGQVDNEDEAQPAKKLKLGQEQDHTQTQPQPEAAPSPPSLVNENEVPESEEHESDGINTDLELSESDSEVSEGE